MREAFALDAAEARSMVEAQARSGRPLLEAFHYRHHAVMRRAEALVRAGGLGALHTGAAEFHVAIPKAPGELRWIAEQGGGAMMDLGCYPLHALRTLIGAEPDIASARGAFEAGVDTAMRAELVFPVGVSASIACSMTAEAPSAWLSLEGERGRLDIVNFVAPQLGCRFTTTIAGDASPPTARQPTPRS